MHSILRSKDLFEPFFVGFVEVFIHSGSDEEMEELTLFWSKFFELINKMDTELKTSTIF